MKLRLPAALAAAFSALPAALGVFGVLAAFALPAEAQRNRAAAEWAPVEGEVIVRFKADAALARRYALAAAGSRGEAGAVRSALAARAAELGARHGRVLEAGQAIGERTQVVRAAAGSGLSAAQLAAQLAADPEVEFAEPNGRKRRLAAPNDPLYPALPAGQRNRGPDAGQWYLRAPTATVVSSIDIERAWDITRGSPNLVVAVLDTGVRGDHPDLVNRLLPGFDMVSDARIANDGDGRDNDPSDPGDWVTSADIAGNGNLFSGCSPENSSWHGTTTTSLVAAATDDSTGMAGAAPNVRAFHVRVLGKCYGTDSDIQAGMRWAGGLVVPGLPNNPNPARVINMSLGGSGACSAGYQAAVDELLAAGVVVVAAAGNSAGGPVGTPANCRGVIGVAALRHAGSKVGFSDLGPQIAIAAPGGNCINITAGSPCIYPILGATNTGTRGPVSSGWTDSFDITVGTSFSSPLVAATAALMFSAQPLLSVTELRSRMTATARAFPTSGADNGPDDPTPVVACRAPQNGVEQLQCYCTTGLCGAGMLDAGAAVAAAIRTVARITVQTQSPQAGTAVALSAAGSLPTVGSNVTGWAWSVADGGGIVSGFSSATNAQTATLTPTGAGSFTVALTVTDATGSSSQTTQVVTVAAAQPQPQPQPPPAGGGGSGGGGGGGGAAHPGWLLGLLLATCWLARRQRLART